MQPRINHLISRHHQIVLFTLVQNSLTNKPESFMSTWRNDLAAAWPCKCSRMPPPDSRPSPQRRWQPIDLRVLLIRHWIPTLVLVQVHLTTCRILEFKMMWDWRIRCYATTTGTNHSRTKTPIVIIIIIIDATTTLYFWKTFASCPNERDMGPLLIWICSFRCVVRRDRSLCLHTHTPRS